MQFDLTFPIQSSDSRELTLNAGEALFVLGANGTGKSSLMLHFFQQHSGASRKISAHRQTWMESDALTMTPSNKVDAERTIKSQDIDPQSRHSDHYGAMRTNITIFELVNAENVRARAMMNAHDDGDDDRFNEAAENEAPITILNRLLKQSNLPIKIAIRANERVVASKNDGPEYSAAELSDGERNALLIAGDVLTAPRESLLLIDEPERHLHRSIISPLLNQLFEYRPDCAFVISTHDYDLPVDNPKARILLLRSCAFNGGSPYWDADLLSAHDSIDDQLKRDLLGARRKIVFVEGGENSLDKKLYSLIFPKASIIPKGSCHDVKNAVDGAREVKEFHWLGAFGIIDGDGLDPSPTEVKCADGIYPLPYYSVEAIYFHPCVIRKVAERQGAVLEVDGSNLAESAIKSGVMAIKNHTDRLSKNTAKKAARDSIITQIPNDDQIISGCEIVITNDGQSIHTAHKNKLDEAVSSGDWDAILKLCSVRETDALESISKELKFRTRDDYLGAVRKLLSQDEKTLEFVRGLFGDLQSKLLS